MTSEYNKKTRAIAKGITMFRIIFYLNLLLFLLPTSNQINTPAQISEHSIAVEEYAVYSTIIQKEFLSKEIDLVVIENSTLDYEQANRKSISKELDWTFSNLEATTIDSYVVKVRKSHKLSNLFKLPVKYVLVDKKDDEKLFQKGGGGWNAFYKKYPRSPGIIGLSRVGFNKPMSQALLYVRVWCGGLCGEGTWVILAKEKEGWAIQDKFTNVIS